MQKVDRLIQWAKQFDNTYIHPSISLQQINGFGLGGLCVQDTLDNEQDLIRIDLRLSINSLNASRNDFGKAFTACLKRIQCEELDQLLQPSSGYEGSIHHHNNDMFDSNAIMFYAFLVYERFVLREESFWWPYLDLLPETFDTPLYFSDKLMNELAGSNLYKSAQSIRDRLERIYEFVIAKMIQTEREYFPSEHFTLENFIWAYSVVWSRVFPIQFGNEILPTLLPVIDILNHKYNENVTYFTDTTVNTFALKAHSILHNGQQIFNNYGAKSNDSFLLSYGFVVENNSQDTMYIQLGVAADDENVLAQKNRLLKQNGLRLGYYLTKDGLPQDLFRALRICVLNEEELYYFENDQISDIISFRNEEQVLGIKYKLRQKLSHFPTDVEYDRKLLSELTSKESLSVEEYRLKNILVYRIGQKEILLKALQVILDSEQDLIRRVQSQLPTMLHSYLSQPESVASEANQWVQKNNLVNTQFTVDDTEGIEMRTISQINPGEDILKLNLSDVITMETVLNSPIGSLIQSLFLADSMEGEHEVFDEESIFMLYLMYAKFGTLPDQKFDNYFKSLPSEFNCCLLFSEEELQQLNDASLVEETLSLRDGLQQTYDQIVELLQNAQEETPEQDSFNKVVQLDAANVLTFDNFLWAYILFDTSVCRVECEAEQYKEKAFIVPIAALHPAVLPYNPTLRIDAPWFDESDCSIHITAVSQFNSGSIIATNALAEKAHDELLLRFGITLAYAADLSQRYTVQTYALELDEAVSSHLNSETKLQLMEILNLGSEHLLRRYGKPRRLLNTLRLCFMSEEEAQYNLQHIEEIEDLETQVDAIAVLENILESLIGSDADEDQVMMDDYNDIRSIFIQNYRQSIDNLIRSSRSELYK